MLHSDHVSELNYIVQQDGERAITEDDFTGLLYNIQMCEFDLGDVLYFLLIVAFFFCQKCVQKKSHPSF